VKSIVIAVASAYSISNSDAKFPVSPEMHLKTTLNPGFNDQADPVECHSPKLKRA